MAGEFLQRVTERLAHDATPTIIAGDFNHEVGSLPSWATLNNLGFVEMNQLYERHYV